MTAFEPSIELLNAIRTRISGSAAFMALVPDALSLRDSNGKPELPLIVNVGETQTVYRRFNSTVFATLHVWMQEPGLAGSKAIADAIGAAVLVDAQIDGVLTLDNFICHDLRVTQTQFLRDPHGSFSHGVVTVAGIMKAK
jgi:Protein of unknown function (DUF3168)